MYNTDQVPIELEADSKRTLNGKGSDCVYITGDTSLQKRFCTLNITTVARVVAGDTHNLVPPLVVFIGGGNVSKAEVDQYHPDVKWSFQCNGWVDQHEWAKYLKVI